MKGGFNSTMMSYFVHGTCIIYYEYRDTTVYKTFPSGDRKRFSYFCRIILCGDNKVSIYVSLLNPITRPQSVSAVPQGISDLV